MLLLYFSVSDIEQAPAADLPMFKSSPCTSGVKGKAEALRRLNVYPELSRISFNTCRDVLPDEAGVCDSGGHQVYSKDVFFHCYGRGQISDSARTVLCQHLISGGR